MATASLNFLLATPRKVKRTTPNQELRSMKMGKKSGFSASGKRTYVGYAKPHVIAKMKTVMERPWPCAVSWSMADSRRVLIEVMFSTITKARRRAD